MVLFKYIYKSVFIAFTVVLFSCFFACERESLYEDKDAKLKFSSSRVTFDTIFTTIGSITKRLIVHNPYNKDIKTDIYLVGSNQSYFSLNVNGVSSKKLSGVDIPAKDSIFIFIKVTLDPNNGNTPMLVSDTIAFYTNDNKQTVELLAYGQDAHFIIPDKLYGGNTPYSIVSKEGEEVRWTKEKPYVIYGYAVVDSVGKLIIEAGTQIYFHKNGGLWVYKGGCLNVNGTLQEPVVFQGDRKEAFFEDDYEQWDRILINEGREDNIINYAIIQNAFIGIQTEIEDRSMGNKLILSNTIIKKSAGVGLLSKGYHIEAYNNVIANCGEYCLALTQGGKYFFTSNTIYNGYNLGQRSTPSVYMSNYYILSEKSGMTTIISDFACDFKNNIVWGNNTKEFSCSYVKEAAFEPSLTNCLIKTDTSFSFFSNIILNKNPLFGKAADYDFSLQSSSPCKNAGLQTTITTDIKGNARNNPPSIGAYE